MADYSKHSPEAIAISNVVEAKSSIFDGERLNTINGAQKSTPANSKSQLRRDRNKAATRDNQGIIPTTNGTGNQPIVPRGLNSNEDKNRFYHGETTNDNGENSAKQKPGAARGQFSNNNTAGETTPGREEKSKGGDKPGYAEVSKVTAPTQSVTNTPRSQGLKRKIVGFDNSEKNKTRQSLGSSTDQVAQERLKFGAWQEPNIDRQKHLVERLAPFRPPPPPDPRFNTWVNHFEYYWKIGVDEKPTRKKLDDSLRSNLIKQEEGFDSNTYSSSSFTSGYSHQNSRHQQNHRLLGQRPKTTPGRVTIMGGEEDNKDNDIGGRQEGERFTRSSTGERAWTTNGHGRTSYRSKSEGHLHNGLPMIPGLDRRYMGLQSVRGEEMRSIVDRLTRMTSAYHAKFAPNPHVWCDESPGAHMVMKRENTIA